MESKSLRDPAARKNGTTRTVYRAVCFLTDQETTHPITVDCGGPVLVDATAWALFRRGICVKTL